METRLPQGRRRRQRFFTPIFLLLFEVATKMMMLFFDRLLALSPFRKQPSRKEEGSQQVVLCNGLVVTS